jgi:hypothetical protein
MNTHTQTPTHNRNFDTFAKACRFKTGTHFLDSGGDNGRAWQKPAIDETVKPVTIEARDYEWKGEQRFEISATIQTAHFLSEALKVDFDLQTQFAEFADEEGNENLSWFELGEKFATERLGLFQHARDNAYNGENDLSEVYVWEVYNAEEKVSDWFYCDEPLTVIYVHTGADVRGGYGKPVFCRSRGELPVPFDLCAEFWAESGTDEDGADLSREQLDAICEKWRSGYSSRPASQVEKDVETLVSQTPETVTVKLKTGETVTVYAQIPCV